MDKKSEGLRCKNCGAFVSPDSESTAEYFHYYCRNCMSVGVIEVTKENYHIGQKKYPKEKFKNELPF